MKKINGILWGIVLIALGVVLALKFTNVLDFELFFEGWWSLFIIVPCTVELITGPERLGSLFGVGIGVALLLAAQEIITYDLVWKMAVPAVFVLIGIKIIIGCIFAKKRAEAVRSDPNGKPKHVAVFSGADVDYNGLEFTEADMIGVFGGVDCDLRGAVITGDIYINVCAVFGGVDIYLPPNVKVKSSTVSVFGGVENNSNPMPLTSAEYTAYISGCCIFGGVEIK